MKKINIGELLTENYSQEELIEWLDTSHQAMLDTMRKGLASQNMAMIGMCAESLAMVSSVTKALNEKVNGKKPLQVV